MAPVHPGYEVVVMRQERIQKQKRPAPRRYDVYAALPLDPRDPDIVSVKARQRESSAVRRG
jgi:hypothetical protein